MLTLHKLSIFMAVYEKHSFNAAAAELYMAQSAVSQHIHTLESALGVALFERTSRGVKPTPAADTLYDYAARILALVADAERAVARLNDAQTGQLIVSATPGVSVYLIPAWLQQFQTTHPTVNVSLQTALTSEVVRDVLNGKYDLGFVEGDLDELDHEALAKTRVQDVDYVIVVHADHEWAARGSISVKALHGVPFINRQPSSRARRWLETTLKPFGVKLKNTAELDSPGAIKYALLNRMGVAVLPRYSIEREIERGELHALTLDETPLSRPLVMVWDGRKPLTPIQRAFVGMVGAHIL
jgi:DNA-binding transcriptional LysR family regulator